ncbi:MAG TPA: HEAT repeat domain-containing protein [Pyrinomonadaceae bacterium]|nr:HEAT repeat domain-containing protein [Pyrinomonadaceae bacterium]
MNTMNRSSCCARISWFVLPCALIPLIGSMLVIAQSRIVRPDSQTNSNRSGKRQHVATLHSSDTPQGSHVALTSDQSLNDYEAYRRGDRFYLKIPAADVPRAEATRGRGYADVKAQRSGDSTVLSFRLQPGATAHVEQQRSNKLDVVFTMPGASVTAPTSNSGREVARANNRSNSEPSARTDSTRKANAEKANASKGSSPLKSSTASPTNSSSPGAKAAASPATLAESSKPGASPLANPSPTKPSTATLPQKTSATTTASPTNHPTAQPPTQTSANAWTNFEELAHYWMLSAQLNPIPVAIAAVVLLLLIALFVFQRRRAKATRRVRPGKSREVNLATATGATLSTAAETAPIVTPVAAAAAIAATPSVTEREEAEKAVVTSSPVDPARQARVAGVTEQVKNVMAGNEYDQRVIGSDDRETRQLVGAELLSALVGRNIQRRDRARAAFMEHGYFDDATRDLRIAESPNERAAAARRLSFVHDREATPHLIAALDDPAPEVRRTAVEALMDLRDPAAIAPLNSLMQTESDRKVPRTLIKHAIDSCASSEPASAAAAVSNFSAANPTAPTSQPPIEPEREVIEL